MMRKGGSFCNKIGVIIGKKGEIEIDWQHVTEMYGDYEK
jgi:hypothetical protein